MTGIPLQVIDHCNAQVKKVSQPKASTKNKNQSNADKLELKREANAKIQTHTEEEEESGEFPSFAFRKHDLA